MDEEMMNYQAMTMVNSHSKAVSDARERSVENTHVEYSRKQNVEAQRLRKAIVAITLIGVSFFAGMKANNAIVNDNNVVIPIKSEYKQEVDNKILYYEKMMGPSGDITKRIITNYGHNADTGQVFFDYYPGNLINNIIEASQISDTDARCVIIAAFNLIGESNRAEVFEGVFTSLANKKDMLNNESADFSYLTTGSSLGFLNALGYEDWHDYQMHERDNIKVIKSLENYVTGSVRSK